MEFIGYYAGAVQKANSISLFESKRGIDDNKGGGSLIENRKEPNRLRLGLVSAPGLPATICHKISEELGDILSKEIESEKEWEVEVEVDRLTGAVDKVEEIMKQAGSRKEANDWDYVISLTDLPIFVDGLIVLSDADVDACIAQVSLPAFGLFSTPKKIEKTIIQIVKELYYRGFNRELSVPLNKKGPGFLANDKKSRLMNRVPRIFKFTEVERCEEQGENNERTVRFFTNPKVKGRLKVILGMTIANRPWSILPSFKKVVGLAFATGSYMLIFNTLWKLSNIYEIPRFIALTSLAMIGMVAWIILAHNLWEKRTNFNSMRLRGLYNMTTVTTLGISVVIFYIAMFILFLFAVAIFVPANLFEEVIGHSVDLVDYLKLAWLVSSAATVAGAIGAGLEDQEEVRKSTYGYRQYLRSKAVEEQEEAKKEEI